MHAYPTHEEWIERQRRRKIVIKQLGRGVSETTIPNAEEVDAALSALSGLLLAAAQSSEPGQLLRRALDLRAALKVGAKLSLDEIAADEFYALLIVEEEQARFDQERLNLHG